jgi:hypothetical protein
MLKIDEKLRADLHHKGALTVDARGEEVLVGLSYAETILYISFFESLMTTEVSGAADAYKELQFRHFAARAAKINGHYDSKNRCSRR